MEVNKLIQIVTKSNKNNNTEFYEESINILENLNEKVIYEIPNDEYILEPIRLYLLANMYYIYLCSLKDIKKDMIHRKLPLNKTGINNLFAQLRAIEKYNTSELCKKGNSYMYNVCVVISPKQLYYSNLIRVKNKYSNISLLFGYESIEILNHQNMDMLCNNKKVLYKIQTFYKMHSKLDSKLKDNIILHSRSVIPILGTISNMKIEIITNIMEQDFYKTMEKRLKPYTNVYIFDDRLEKSGKTYTGYLYGLYNEYIPRLDYIKNLKELLVNPRHYFHFMGIKFMSISLRMRQLENESTISAFVQLILLNEINDYRTNNSFKFLI
jgi:hypothetical protein